MLSLGISAIHITAPIGKKAITPIKAVPMVQPLNHDHAAVLAGIAIWTLVT
jgi:hypothetical protein